MECWLAREKPVAPVELLEKATRKRLRREMQQARSPEAAARRLISETQLELETLRRALVASPE